MLTRYELNEKFHECRFYDIQMEPTTEMDGETCIILSYELLKEWDEKASEIVEGEPINDAVYDEYGNCIDGADEYPFLTIVRVTHKEGSVTIEPVHKLFFLEKGRRWYLRNSLLVYSDENEKLNEHLDDDRSYKSMALLYQYCRKFDVNVMQARLRTEKWTAKKWKEVIGQIDNDWCWEWQP